jgi:hypothetical protein
VSGFTVGDIALDRAAKALPDHRVSQLQRLAMRRARAERHRQAAAQPTHRSVGE